MDGSGGQERGVGLEAPTGGPVETANTPFTFTLRNTGKPASAIPGLHPDEAIGNMDHDVYRLSASVEGEGWSARILNALAAVEAGAGQPISVYVSREASASQEAILTLRATSESDPTKTAVTTLSLGDGGRTQ